MVFADLLEQVGSTGRFQVVHTILLCLPILMMASHNILQNFVAAVPPHFCSAHTNLSASTRMSTAEMLRITVPLDANGSPEKCRRYESPQWHLLANNGSTDPEVWEGSEQAALRGCDDGWTYDDRERSSSIISEVSVYLSNYPAIYLSRSVSDSFSHSPCLSINLLCAILCLGQYHIT